MFRAASFFAKARPRKTTIATTAKAPSAIPTIAPTLSPAKSAAAALATTLGGLPTPKEGFPGACVFIDAKEVSKDADVTRSKHGGAPWSRAQSWVKRSEPLL
jgi:hypothetical protein